MQLKQISVARIAEKAEKELLESVAQKNNVAEFLGSEDEVIDVNTADLDFVSPQSSMDEVQGTSGGKALHSDKQSCLDEELTWPQMKTREGYRKMNVKMMEVLMVLVSTYKVSENKAAACL